MTLVLFSSPARRRYGGAATDSNLAVDTYTSATSAPTVTSRTYRGARSHTDLTLDGDVGGSGGVGATWRSKSVSSEYDRRAASPTSYARATSPAPQHYSSSISRRDRSVPRSEILYGGSSRDRDISLSRYDNYHHHGRDRSLPRESFTPTRDYFSRAAMINGGLTAQSPIGPPPVAHSSRRDDHAAFGRRRSNLVRSNSFRDLRELENEYFPAASALRQQQQPRRARHQTLAFGVSAADLAAATAAGGRGAGDDLDWRVGAPRVPLVPSAMPGVSAGLFRSSGDVMGGFSSDMSCGGNMVSTADQGYASQAGSRAGSVTVSTWFVQLVY